MTFSVVVIVHGGNMQYSQHIHIHVPQLNFRGASAWSPSDTLQPRGWDSCLLVLKILLKNAIFSIMPTLQGSLINLIKYGGKLFSQHALQNHHSVKFSTIYLIVRVICRCFPSLWISLSCRDSLWHNPQTDRGYDPALDHCHTVKVFWSFQCSWKHLRSFSLWIVRILSARGKWHGQGQRSICHSWNYCFFIFGGLYFVPVHVMPYLLLNPYFHKENVWRRPDTW